MRKAYTLLYFLLVSAWVVSGCAGLQRTREPSSYTESTALLTDNLSREVLEEATSVLLNHNLPLAVVNERLGFIQTEYVPAYMVDTSLTRAGNAVQVKFSLHVDSLLGRRRTQFKAFTRALHSSYAPLITRYLLDQITAEVAQKLDVPYRPRVSRKELEPVLQRLAREQEKQPHFQQGIRAIGVIAGVLFLVSLLSGAFAASSGG